jgi:hypothetical protein
MSSFEKVSFGNDVGSSSATPSSYLQGNPVGQFDLNPWSLHRGVLESYLPDVTSSLGKDLPSFIPKDWNDSELVIPSPPVFPVTETQEMIPVAQYSPAENSSHPLYFDRLTGFNISSDSDPLTQSQGVIPVIESPSVIPVIESQEVIPVTHYSKAENSSHSQPLNRPTGLNLSKERMGGVQDSLTQARSKVKPPLSSSAKYAITANLSHDTAAGDTTNTDRITYDPSISGIITNRTKTKVKLMARFDDSKNQSFTNITASLGANGRYNLTPGQLQKIYGGVLPDGSHTLRLQLMTGLGKRVFASQTLSFHLDTLAPSSPSLDIMPPDDTGYSNSDNITNQAKPNIIGASDPGTTVELFSNEQYIGQTSAQYGNWLFLSPELTDGNYSLTAIATDVAGNRSLPSTPLNLTIDTTAPELTVTSELVIEDLVMERPMDYFRMSSTERFVARTPAPPSPTNATKIYPESEFTGLVNGTGSDIALFSYRLSGQNASPVILDSTGHFSQRFNLNGLRSGYHNLTLTCIDLAGNQRLSSTIIDVRLPGVDTTPSNFGVIGSVPEYQVISGIDDEGNLFEVIRST